MLYLENMFNILSRRPFRVKERGRFTRDNVARQRSARFLKNVNTICWDLRAIVRTIPKKRDRRDRPSTAGCAQNRERLFKNITDDDDAFFRCVFVSARSSDEIFPTGRTRSADALNRSPRRAARR